MPTNLITIGASGAAAARAGLEVTAQNIANAGNSNYVRRSIDQSELVGTAVIDFTVSSAFSGVRAGSVQRMSGELLQSRVRDSQADLNRVGAQMSGLRDAEIALEEARVFDGLVAFEASLTLLESDPTDPALRTATVETARQLTQTFRSADLALAGTGDAIEREVLLQVDDVNAFAAQLARVNVALVNAREGTPGRAALLDERDATLRDLSNEIGIASSFDEFGAVTVEVEGAPRLMLVERATTVAFGAQIGPDRSVNYTVGNATIDVAGGAVAGRAAALDQIAGLETELDTIAASTITRANTAQSAGAALDGSAGQPLFSGGDAGSIRVALTNGSGLALAAAGSPPASRDTTNLGALIAAFAADDGPITAIDRTLVALSGRVAGLGMTAEGLAIIGDNARAELLGQTGVDLDEEAANLIRLQQAFEANSRVIQVASNVFDTILALN